MFQMVPCVMANICWKFHENPLIDFTLVLLTGTPGAPRWEIVKQSRQVWNSQANYLLCRAWRFMKISSKSIYSFFHNISNKHGSKKWINQPRIQEVNRNTPKRFQIAPCVISVRFGKFHENPFNRFSAMLLTDTDSSEKVEKNFPMFKGLNRTPWKCSRLFIVSSPTYPENFMKIRLAFFR